MPLFLLISLLTRRLNLSTQKGAGKGRSVQWPGGRYRRCACRWSLGSRCSELFLTNVGWLTVTGYADTLG